MHNEFILGDCIEVMKTLPEKSFDAIITDPPYLCTDLHFDKDGLDITELTKTCLPLLKDNGYFISFGSVELLADLAKTFPIRWTGGWLKTNPVMRSAVAKKPMSKLELYAVMAHPKHKVKHLTFNKFKIEEGKPYRRVMHKTGYSRDTRDSITRMNGSGWTKEGYVCEGDSTRWQTDVIKAPNKCSMPLTERTKHPTQKPVKLLTTLIKWCTNENDFILDPFAGSGSTAVACLENNRKYYCIEKNKEYYDWAIERLAIKNNDT